MFFKNLQIYRLLGPINVAQLQRGTFAACPPNARASRGWAPPVESEPDSLALMQDGNVLIALATEERLLPTDVINREVAQRAAVLEAEQGYAPGRKQRRELRERVVEELLPKAFTRLRLTRAWFNVEKGWFVVDAGTPSRAEAVIEHLRYSLDELPLGPFVTSQSPASAMADWLLGDAPFDFSVDRTCQVKGSGTVTYQDRPLEGTDDIRSQLASGLLPTKLAMTWNDRLSFMLTDTLAIKRLTFLDITRAEEESDFAIQSGELCRFLPALEEALGGPAL